MLEEMARIRAKPSGDSYRAGSPDIPYPPELELDPNVSLSTCMSCLLFTAAHGCTAVPCCSHKRRATTCWGLCSCVVDTMQYVCTCLCASKGCVPSRRYCTNACNVSCCS
jgi:hypothetical protein